VRATLRTIGVSASVAACERREGEPLRDLYRRADRALAREKRGTRRSAAVATSQAVAMGS
jgi:GGDEF domain-containing protein